jgi:hypothetical protein
MARKKDAHRTKPSSSKTEASKQQPQISVPGKTPPPSPKPTTKKPRTGLIRWLLEGHVEHTEGPYEAKIHHKTHPWYKVMCLTGVDYFSTLGYQPGIAALAAGVLSPIATLVLVMVTLFGALPIYKKVAQDSPHGDGSIAMLENLLPFWAGKLFVLALLGFVATDFIITITLSAADATAHIVENPFAPAVLHHNIVPVTIGLIALLGVVFLKGFREAIGIAVVLVIIFLGLNAVVLSRGLYEVFAHPKEITDWWTALSTNRGGNPVLVAGAVLLAFPKLALGLSGFETGAAVMPLVQGDPGEPDAKPTGRIRNTRKLLTWAAVIMSVYLLCSSVVTTMHIPAHEFRAATATAPAGDANGRALAYLAHQFFGDGFGTLYDLSTILILWFAGASAMAGLLNIVPRFLPRYGMAPEWTRAARPLVLIFTAVAFLVTVIFKANVDAQGGAYATGVLVLMTSAAIAVTLAYRKEKRRGAMIGTIVIALVLLYTTVANVFERPDGMKIASVFILGIVVFSLVSRIWRVLELRAIGVELDDEARRMVAEAAAGDNLIRIIPNRPEEGDEKEYDRQARESREDHQIPDSEKLIFFEVYVTDASEFAGVLRIEGVRCGSHNVLRARATAIPNAIAAFLLWIQRETGKRPHAYLSWTEGNPVAKMFQFLLFGKGETAPLTREILRQIERDPRARPVVHTA